jgi:hypothetical protein
MLPLPPQSCPKAFYINEDTRSPFNMDFNAMNDTSPSCCALLSVFSSEPVELAAPSDEGFFAVNASTSLCTIFCSAYG